LTSIKVLLVHALDSLLGFLDGRVGDKAEPTGSAGLSVHDDDGVLDGTELGESVLELLGTGVEGKVADKDFSLGVLEMGGGNVLAAF
jgi:hypothetical protein